MLRAALASGHPWLDGITYERLWEEGYARLNRPEGWMPFANGGFATRSGKAELYSEAQREAGLDPLPSAGDIPSGDGLQLITGKQLHYLNSGYNNMERHRRRAGELFIELHAEDARRRGVADRRRGGVCETVSAKCAPSAASPIASARASRGCRSAAPSTRTASAVPSMRSPRRSPPTGAAAAASTMRSWRWFPSRFRRWFQVQPRSWILRGEAMPTVSRIRSACPSTSSS